MATLVPPRNGGTSAPPTVNQSTKELFNAALQSRVPTNNYITHLKIWESVNEGPPPPAGSSAVQRKARYLILAVQRDTGRVTLNKAKRNANGTFSIGKDWDLNTLKEITVHDATTFTLTLSRSYSWQTERSKEQLLFLHSAVKIFRKYTGEDGPNCIGLEGAELLDSNGGSSAPAPAPSSTMPRTASPASRPSGESRRGPTINTHIPSEHSRDSPHSASSRTARSNSNAGQDGFYSAREGSAISPLPMAPIPTISTGLGGSTSGESRLDRRPTMQRNASAGASMMSPDAQIESLAVPPPPQSISQGNSPQLGEAELPDVSIKPIRMARSPSRLAASGASATFVSESDAKTSGTTDRSSPTASLSKSVLSATSTLRPNKGPNRSVESLGVSSSGGDARARLSSIEPVRGGAAYEKMLLAGTGLTGVAEGDDGEEEDEDPYGGAEITDVDGGDEGREEILPRSVRKPSTKRRQTRLNSQDIRDAGEVGNVSAELVDDDDEEDTTLANVEEMLEGFEWRHNGPAGGLTASGAPGALRRGAKGGRGTADVIEARLLDELAALDAANIHAIIESDDRVSLVVRHMEEALNQLDFIDGMIATFKMQLNARADDISHIESQNRGLQVHTSNQRALSAEIEKLLSTVHVDEYAVEALLEQEFETDEGIGEMERAGAALYKAMLQARRTEEESGGGDTGGAGLAAATERLEEYAALANEFAKRLLAFLTQMFNAQTKAILRDPARLSSLSPPHPTIESHQDVENVLGRYCGLLLYAKEVSPDYFSRISVAYLASASERYKSEMITLFSVWRNQIARVTDEEVAEASFVLSGQLANSSGANRSGTVRRGARSGGGKGSKGPGEVAGYEAFNQILMTVIPLVAREQGFIADLLHINNNAVTFADFMDLEVYFRRRAAALFSTPSVSGPLRDMKSALDLLFGFLAPEWQTLADQVFAKDRVQLVGVLGALDRALLEADELGNDFLLRTLGKLHMRLTSQLEKFISEQIRAIEQTKLTVKKRKGVAHFIKIFPTFVERIEAQLLNSEVLNIRTTIDHYYEQICNTMFDALQTMAIPKMDGGGMTNLHSSNVDEDKGLLNHHVILIENMYHFVKDVGRLKGSAALGPLLKRAQGILEDALSAYVQSALRRPLGKMVDFGDGIDALLRSTPANEVSLHSAYNRQAAKRLVKEYSSKDIRKSIEALSKRVIKHFDDEEITTLSEGLNGASNFYDTSGISAEEIIEVLGRVWRNLEDGFTMECERMQRILRECYANTNDSSKLLCDFTMEDVRKPFASSAPAGRRR